MTIVLRDPTGDSVTLSSSVPDIMAVKKIAETHIISPTEAHSNEVAFDCIWVDNVYSVLADYVSRRK